MTSPNKVGIIYHDNCIDGFTAAYVVASNYFKRAYTKFVPYGYRDTIGAAVELAKETDVVYIVDFSFSMEELMLLATHSKVVMLDHHASAFKTLLNKVIAKDDDTLYTIYEPNLEVILCNTLSGAALTYWYFNSVFTLEKMPKLIQYVCDYDLWTHKHSDTSALNKWLSIQENSFTRWEEISILLECPVNRSYTLAQAKAIEHWFIAEIENIAEAAEEVEFALGAFKGIAVASPYSFRNEVCDLLLSKSPNKSFACTWVAKEGHISFSVRSTDGSTAKLLAEHYSGGGHGNSASFRLPYNEFCWDADLHRYTSEY